MTDNPIILRVLGGAWLEEPNDGLRITARKKVAILAFLAMGRQSAPRDLLAGLIWGDVPDAKARASLRQALSELRSAHSVLKDALLVDRTTVTLLPGHITIETDLILAELEEGRLPEGLRGSGETINDVLYGYETLGERFADWVQDIRKSWSDRILSSLSKIAGQKDVPATTRMDFAEAALSFDPLGELQCRFAMQLAAELGDIGKALQIYATFYARMDAELDMEPSLETQDLAVEIKMGIADVETNQPITTQADQPTPQPQSAAARNHGRPVLAILPLKASGTEAIDDYLAEMLVDNIVLGITRTRDISVISRVSIRHLTDRPDVAQVLLNDLGVRYIISGHIRREGSVYYLNVELSKTDEGLVLWVERYETSARDLEDAQSRIFHEVVSRIRPNLQIAELSDARLIDFGHLTAYQKLLRAQELVYTLSAPKFEAAGQQLRQIVTEWDDFSPAQVVLADWHSLAVGQGWSQDVQADFQHIERHLNNAIENDRRNGRALAMLGHNMAIYARHPNQALALFDEALSVSPGDAETLMWTGPTLAFTGQAVEAIARLEQAKALNFENPLGFRYDHFLAIAYFAADRMEEAAQMGLASAVRNGRYVSNLRVTAAASAAIGKLDTAREMTARVLAIEPDFRVSKLVADHPFRDPAQRALYGKLLVQAGLPN